ncbi:MAG: hypothetical protein V2I51_20045 [Anderseniella sp.]|jgi:hypothetical protein|nr:hypothetical protein [Anderseniella sp.]
MLTKTTLKPGQKGTKGLTKKYGDRLVCVRYKYDQETGRRYTTVELIEEESDRRIDSKADKVQAPVPTPQRLGVRVEYWETDVREKVKAAGGIWRPRQKLWELGYEDIVALALESRVVGDDFTSS